MRYMGIDYGTRRIGIALSDESGSMAFPEKIVENHGLESAAKGLLALAKEKGVGEIVLGESKNYQGQPNVVQPEIDAFKKMLEAALPVHYQNETMSSAEASRGETNQLDASAAAIILNTYLTRKRLGLK